MPFCFPIIHPSKVVRHAFVVATACVFSCSAGAASYRVIGIADGDTITVLDDDKRMVKCRLYGIDAPEKHQAYGAESKASLSELTFQRIADIGFWGATDTGGRSAKSTSTGWMSTVSS